MKIILYILLLLLIGFLIFLWIKFIKTPKVGSLSMITGAVKSGKSLLSVRIAYKEYKKRLLVYNIIIFLRNKLFLKFIKQPEKPYLYSNIPLKCDYVPLTLDLLLRKERFNYNSVVYICEASLVADNSTFKYPKVNTSLNYFCKLFGHETHGGVLLFDTQAIGDVAIGIRRCINTNFFVHHSRKGLFFHWMWLCEERYSEDGSVMTTYNGDIENDLKLLLIPKSTYKLYDRYCYSIFTDSKDRVDNVISNPKFFKPILKAKEVLSFKEGIIEEL